MKARYRGEVPVSICQSRSNGGKRREQESNMFKIPQLAPSAHTWLSCMKLLLHRETVICPSTGPRVQLSSLTPKLIWGCGSEGKKAGLHGLQVARLLQASCLQLQEIGRLELYSTPKGATASLSALRPLLLCLSRNLFTPRSCPPCGCSFAFAVQSNPRPLSLPWKITERARPVKGERAWLGYYKAS
ncbi:hypothetical protein BDV97DRAFT_127437 [Delphinella strobiligena]|nr:hypothetical protein BDV97DRAFT_127437 [Delphinella strobiligena]